jgi:hypothetical protein
MTSEHLPATMQSTPEKRELALLRAVGLDRAAPEQRELALAIADRYGLDLMLKPLVLIEGRPYLTRDALLHIAHRSGQLDGMETTEPALADGFWRATCSVFRKDMSHPFTYAGRYPERGGNAKFAPEMALKVAESMALRRAFDIAAPSADERWDTEAPAIVSQPAPTLAEVARAKAAEATLEPASEPEAVIVVSEPTEAVSGCPARSPWGDESEPCVLPAGHKANHKTDGRESWA